MKKKLFIGSMLVIFFGGCKKEDDNDQQVVVKAPVAGFIANKTAIAPGESVIFTDQSLNNPTIWTWDFGDGNTSTNENPTHTFNNAGQYTVSLTVANSAGNNTVTKTDYIIVTPTGVAPQSAFTYNPSTVYISTSVNFADQSSNAPTSWAWNFGDGGTSNIQNPTHGFIATGSYVVSLTATNAFGNTTTTDTIDVTNAADYLAGNYSVVDSVNGFTFSYSDNMVASSTVNERVSVNKFGDYAGGNVYFTVSGSTITLPTQTVLCGIPAANHTFYGSGVINGNGGPGTTITINFTDFVNGNSISGVETYTKM